MQKVINSYRGFILYIRSGYEKYWIEYRTAAYKWIYMWIFSF